MNVLFIGNSHTFVNDMPQIVKINADVDIDVFMIARGGITFETHLNDPSVLFAFKQNYDAIILQQAAHVPCPSKEETLRDGKLLIDLARKYHKNVYVMKPWPREDDKDGYQVICDIYQTLSEENQVTIIDAGEAIVQMNRGHGCYLKDHEHLNPLGSYIEACSILHTILHQTTFKGQTLDMYQEHPFEAIELEKNIKDEVEKIIKEL